MPSVPTPLFDLDRRRIAQLTWQLTSRSTPPLEKQMKDTVQGLSSPLPAALQEHGASFLFRSSRGI